MILANGALLPDSQLPALLERLEGELTHTLSTRSLTAEVVIDAIDALGQRLDRGKLDSLIAQYAPPGTMDALEQVRPMLTREALEYKLTAELGPDWAVSKSRPFGEAVFAPLGVLFHIAAGNVGGLPVFTAVEGLLTGNINLVKLPREDKGLSLAVLLELVRTQPQLAPFLYAFDLPSSSTAALSKLAALADGMVTWGGDGAVQAVRAMAPPGCKLVEWGHRLSFAYLTEYENHLEELAALAGHIIATGGLLCSSCQVIFLDTGGLDEAADFCRAFLPLLNSAAARRRAAPGLAAQAALYAHETLLEQIVDRRDFGDQVFSGVGCSLVLRRDRELELSPLNGNVLVKALPRRELIPALRRQRGRLQTAGLICAPEERAELTALLTRAGVNRITRAGSMSHTFLGEGHDGEYPLRRYVRIVDMEI